MFGLKMPKGVGAAGSAFKGADMAGKLNMLGAAFGGDTTELARLISAQQGGGPMASALAPSLQGGEVQTPDLAGDLTADLMRRFGADGSQAPGAVPSRPGGFGRGFGFGRRY